MTGVKLLGLGLWLLLWPVRLVADYSFDSLALASAPWEPGVLAAAIVTAALVGLWLLGWRQHRLRRRGWSGSGTLPERSSDLGSPVTARG